MEPPLVLFSLIPPRLPTFHNLGESYLKGRKSRKGKKRKKISILNSLLPSFSFPHLKVGGLAPNEVEAHSGAHTVETITPRSTRVDAEHSVGAVVVDAQDVAVATHKYRGLQPTQAARNTRQRTSSTKTYVGHQYLCTFALKALPLGVGEPHCVVVDVAVDRHHALTHSRKSLHSVATTDVARTPHLVHLGKKLRQVVVEGTVKV